MAATNAALLIASATHGSSIGIPQSVEWSHSLSESVIRSEGKKGPGAVGVFAEDFLASVGWLVGAPKAANGSPASLVIVLKEHDGTTSITMTITSMKAMGSSFSMNRDAPPGAYSQNFRHVGDMDSLPLTIS